MIVEPLGLPEVLLLKPRVLRDERGHFLETWRDAEYRALGIGPFVQDNVSRSKKGVLRGLHYQHPAGQAKLVSVVHGRVFDVAVDIRRGSPTFGKWAAAELAHETGFQLYVPAGFAHGFLALTDDVVVSYKCSAYYDASAEHGVRWDDPGIGIRWPNTQPMLSERDRDSPPLSAIAPNELPAY